MNVFDQSILCPGDMILYYTPGLIDTIIAEKTGMDVGHVEIYAGSNKSFASRETGVDLYALRLDHIVCVRRVKDALNLGSGCDWFTNFAKGQAYDFKGLLTFTSFVHSGTPGDMFCSEFATNFYRNCLIEIWNPSQRADHTSPRDLWICGAFNTVWAINEQYQ